MGPEEMDHGGWGGEGLLTELLSSLVGTLVPLLLLAGVAFLAVLLLRRAKLVGPGVGPTTPPAAQATDPALAILRDRYARRTRHGGLRGAPTPPPGRVGAALTGRRPRAEDLPRRAGE